MTTGRSIGKIAILGSGALGCYYGGKLHQARHQVHFVLRSDYDHVRAHGISVTSPQGDFKFKPRATRDPSSIGPCDLIIVCLKTTANDALNSLLPPLLHENSLVLSLQNGLGNTETLSQFAPVERILGGLCFICVNRPAPGIIHHLDYGPIAIGEAAGWPEPRTHELATLFQNAGVPCKVTDKLQRAQWEKLVWNIPFNGLGVAGSLGHAFFDSTTTVLPPHRAEALPTDQLLADPRWLEIVTQLMHEIIDVASALDFPIQESLAEKMIANTRTMKDYHPSTVIDFQLGRPLEYESMFGLPLAQARNTKVPIPVMERLCSILRLLINQDAQVRQ